MQAAQSVNKAKRQLRPEADGAVYLFTFNIPVFNICQSTTVSD